MIHALIAEPSPPIAAALSLFLKRAGHTAQVVKNVDEAVAALHGQSPVDLVLASTVDFPGEALCTRIKTAGNPIPVLLCFGAAEESSGPRAQAVAADGYFLLPPRGHQVQALVGLCVQLIEARLKLAQLESKNGSAGQKGSDADFFKKYMVHEVKRSRRYRMPVSLVLAGLDALPSGRSSTERTRLKSEVITALSLLLRDIDIAVATSGDRFLIFLPNTGREGAVKVGTKVQKRLTQLPTTPGLKASVGVAYYEPQGSAEREITFGKLLAQATTLLRTVQARGGGKVGVGARKVPAKTSVFAR
jgi:PleD family two-component response regulator